MALPAGKSLDAAAVGFATSGAVFLGGVFRGCEQAVNNPITIKEV